jgi:hypothetical protein
LRDYLRQQGRTVFWFGVWEQRLDELSAEDLWANFAQVIRHKYKMLGEKQNVFTAGTVTIVDEAQGSYGDTAFWNGIVKDISGPLKKRIKLSLFCSYGSPSVGLPYNMRDHQTPVTFISKQRISLTPSREPNSPPIGLFYSEDEFNMVVTKLCGSEVEKYTIDVDARNYLFNLTNGHPGAVDSIVAYLFEVCNIHLDGYEFSYN